MSEDKNIAILIKANSDILSFFTSRYRECVDSLEKNKTALFELNIKLEELNKTKNVYSLTTNSKKDLFTPMPKDKNEGEKESQIEAEIKRLLAMQRDLNTKVMEDSTTLKFYSRKIKLLKAAELSISEISDELEDTRNNLTDLEMETKEMREKLSGMKRESAPAVDNSEELSRQRKESEEKLESFRADLTEHGRNILMIDAFDKSYMSTMLDRKVSLKLKDTKTKLETARFLISSDPKRAKQTINEIITDIDNINDDISFLLKKILYNIDTRKPLMDMLESFIEAKTNAHPECTIETDYSGLDSEKKTSYIAATSLLHLLDIAIENVYKHSGANRIIIKLSNRDNKMYAYIKDNGTGIKDDYMDKSPWYSSLHKAVETLYLLNGDMDISGNHENGTLVEFSFPLQ